MDILLIWFHKVFYLLSRCVCLFLRRYSARLILPQIELFLYKKRQRIEHMQPIGYKNNQELGQKMNVLGSYILAMVKVEHGECQNIFNGGLCTIDRFRSSKENMSRGKTSNGKWL